MQSKSTTTDNVLQELLDLIGRDQLAEMDPEDVEGILKAGVPHALKTQLDLMIGAGSERARMWTSDRWLDRAGYSPVQKVAVKQQLSLDKATLEALRQIAAEDDDRDSGVCEKVGGGDQPGLGGNPGVLEGEVEEKSVLLQQGHPRVPGPESKLPS